MLYDGSRWSCCDRVWSIGRGSHQVPLPPRQLCGLIEAVGIWGAAVRCKNKAMGELMKKLAACVGVFSHSAVNNDMLKELQKLQEDLHSIYELNM